MLIGDLTESKTQLGWKSKYDLAALVKEMVASDLKLMWIHQLFDEIIYDTLELFWINKLLMDTCTLKVIGLMKNVKYLKSRWYITLNYFE